MPRRARALVNRPLLSSGVLVISAETDRRIHESLQSFADTGLISHGRLLMVAPYGPLLCILDGVAGRGRASLVDAGHSQPFDTREGPSNRRVIQIKRSTGGAGFTL